MIKNVWEELLSKKQLFVSNDIKEKQPRHIILEGAVRSGKTYLAVLFWRFLINKFNNRSFIMTGRTISSLKRNVLDEMTRIFGIDTNLNINNEFMIGSNKICCFGTDKADSFKTMQGLTASGWYANEVALSHQNSILEAFARCSQEDACIIWETNPDKPSHFVKTDYVDKSGSKFEDGSHNILSYHFELEDNDKLNKNYVESLKQSIPVGTFYNRKIKGLWVATDKAIYTNYKIVSALPDNWRDLPYFYGLDFGWEHPTALVRVIQKDDAYWVEGLLYESHIKDEQLIQVMKANDITGRDLIFCDHNPDKIDTLKNAGFKGACAASKDVRLGIEFIQQKFLNIVDSDMSLKDEIENYENKITPQGIVLNEPVKIHDDYMDAMRYAIYSSSKSVYNKPVMANVQEIITKRRW